MPWPARAARAPRSPSPRWAPSWRGRPPWGRRAPRAAAAPAGSFVPGTPSVGALMPRAPPLANLALRFGPPEYFALLLLGLLVLAYMSGGSMLKALAMAALGLLLGMV